MLLLVHILGDLRAPASRTTSLRSPTEFICATSGTTIKEPLNLTIWPGLAISTISPLSTMSMVRGIEPAGISLDSSCTWKSGGEANDKREKGLERGR